MYSIKLFATSLFFSPLELILQYQWGLCQEVFAPEPGAIAKTHVAKIVLRHFFQIILDKLEMLTGQEGCGWSLFKKNF